jgi:hypothetical protein
MDAGLVAAMTPAAVEFEEFLSRSVCQLVTSVGWPHGRR